MHDRTVHLKLVFSSRSRVSLNGGVVQRRLDNHTPHHTQKTTHRGDDQANGVKHDDRPQLPHGQQTEGDERAENEGQANARRPPKPPPGVCGLSAGGHGQQLAMMFLHRFLRSFTDAITHREPVTTGIEELVQDDSETRV